MTRDQTSEQAPSTGPEVDEVRALGARLTREPAKEAMDFATHVHEYHTEYISLADQKAAFVFTASSAFIVYLSQKDAHLRWLKPLTGWSALDLLAFLGMASLAVGMAAAMAVVAPRFAQTYRGFVYFLSITEDFKSSSDYALTVAGESGKSLILDLLRHAYDLAQVARRKFRALVVAIWGSVVGFAISLVVLFLSKGP